MTYHTCSVNPKQGRAAHDCRAPEGDFSLSAQGLFDLPPDGPVIDREVGIDRVGRVPDGFRLAPGGGQEGEDHDQHGEQVPGVGLMFVVHVFNRRAPKSY